MSNVRDTNLLHQLIHCRFIYFLSRPVMDFEYLQQIKHCHIIRINQSWGKLRIRYKQLSENLKYALFKALFLFYGWWIWFWKTWIIEKLNNSQLICQFAKSAKAVMVEHKSCQHELSNTVSFGCMQHMGISDRI